MKDKLDCRLNKNLQNLSKDVTLVTFIEGWAQIANFERVPVLLKNRNIFCTLAQLFFHWAKKLISYTSKR